MTQPTSSEELKELSHSYVRFIRRNSSWWYLLAIMLILFGVVHLYNNLNNRTKTPAETYREEFVQLQEQIASQEQRIQELEAQVQALKDSNSQQ